MSTILCIDDDPMALELEKSILETNGYTVFTATNGPSGIAIVSQHGVDVVVLDFKMPGMAGDQVAEALLKVQPNLPIVMYTGFLDSVPEWLLWFAAGFLQKGEGPAALLSMIQELIANKKVPASADEANRSIKADAA